MLFNPFKYLIFIFLFVSLSGISQEVEYVDSTMQDSTEQVTDTLKPHSPKRAAWLSAVLPGAGQIYNYKYEERKWYTYAKVTAIWGGGAALIYFLQYNHNEYLRYKNAYIYRLDEDESTIDEFADDPRFTSEVIKNERDSWRKYRDYCALGLLGLYFMNIIEASVTAHFWDYDISEDLSLKVRPILFSPNTSFSSFSPSNNVGIRLSLNF